MDILAVLTQVREVLQQQGRLSYRLLQRQFALDEAALEDLKFELIDVQEVAIDKDGKMLVWKGAERTPLPSSSAPSLSLPPASYTPSHLAERIRAEQSAMEARGEADGERKTITALFADLKGSTALIEGLDPEEARTIIDPALQLMMDAVHRYEGYVAQALGDGIFALFGAPLAHEDHPQRALYAALCMPTDRAMAIMSGRTRPGTEFDALPNTLSHQRLPLSGTTLLRHMPTPIMCVSSAKNTHQASDL
jgi:class 3 adenylate cyclase